MSDEELGDEVKVFRNDADEETECDDGEEQLTEDKKAAEAELNEAEPASSVPHKIHRPIPSMASPSFPMMSGLMSALSPIFPMPMHVPVPVPVPMPVMMPSPYGLHSPNFMTYAALSPSFGMYPPSPMQHRLAMAAASQIRPGPLNPLNHMNPMGMPTCYMSPSGSSQNSDKKANGGGKAKKENHIKKPLNAYMIYQGEMRKSVREEMGKSATSAEVNSEIGKRWQKESAEVQKKYKDLSDQAKEEHKKKYPDWSAKQNYSTSGKKPKQKRDRMESAFSENNEQKKCRARFGIEHTEMWCKCCKRKKKCEYISNPTSADGQEGTSGRSSESPAYPNTVPGPAAPLVNASSENASKTYTPLFPQQTYNPEMMRAFTEVMKQFNPTGSAQVPSTILTPPVQIKEDNSDSDSDVDEDEVIDPTIMEQTHVLTMQQADCTL